MPAPGSGCSSILRTIFTESNKPYEVEIVVAELGESAAGHQMYRITFDGSAARPTKCPVCFQSCTPQVRTWLADRACQTAERHLGQLGYGSRVRQGFRQARVALRRKRQWHPAPTGCHREQIKVLVSEGPHRVDHRAHQFAATCAVRLAVGGDHALVDPPGGLDLDVPAVGEQRGESLALAVGEQPGTGVQGAARLVERVVLASPVTVARLMDATPTAVQGVAGEPDDVEGIHHRDRVGDPVEHHRPRAAAEPAREDLECPSGSAQGSRAGAAPQPAPGTPAALSPPPPPSRTR